MTRLRRGRVAARLVLPLLLLSAPVAQAQQIVFDPSSYKQMIKDATTSIEQLNQLRAQIDQARALYDSFNDGTIVSQLVPDLDLPHLREALPTVQALTAAADGDFAALGRLGERAGEIRDQQRRFTAAKPSDWSEALEASGQAAARDLALGETAADAAGQRLDALHDLTQAIDAAPSARAVLDLQARAAAETAIAVSDQTRLQAIAMAQAAQARLAEQRQREAAAAARQARMERYRRAFEVD